MEKIENRELRSILTTLYVGGVKTDEELNERIAAYLPVEITTLRDLLDKAIVIIQDEKQDCFPHELPEKIKL